MPVTISISVRSQIDTGSLIQVERNEKALGRVQEKIVHTRSTLDWSQSNNISCCDFMTATRLFLQFIFCFSRSCFVPLSDNADHKGIVLLCQSSVFLRDDCLEMQFQQYL